MSGHLAEGDGVGLLTTAEYDVSAGTSFHDGSMKRRRWALLTSSYRPTDAICSEISKDEGQSFMGEAVEGKREAMDAVSWR